MAFIVPKSKYPNPVMQGLRQLEAQAKKTAKKDAEAPAAAPKKKTAAKKGAR